MREKNNLKEDTIRGTMFGAWNDFLLWVFRLYVPLLWLDF